jgi:hypothetical protein
VKSSKTCTDQFDASEKLTEKAGRGENQSLFSFEILSLYKGEKLLLNKKREKNTSFSQ